MWWISNGIRHLFKLYQKSHVWGGTWLCVSDYLKFKIAVYWNTSCSWHVLFLNLLFSTILNYRYLKQILRLLYRSLNYQYDNVFDWTLSDDPQVQEMIRFKEMKKKKSRRVLSESNTNHNSKHSRREARESKYSVHVINNNSQIVGPEVDTF